jgi:hypothetical protein
VNADRRRGAADGRCARMSGRSWPGCAGENAELAMERDVLKRGVAL